MSPRACAAGAMLVATLGLAACGSSTDSDVARVGSVAITRTMLDQRMAAIAAEDPAAGTPKQTLQSRALGFLISSEWLIGEARDEGVAASARAVQARFGERVKSYRGGESEFHEVLEATGQTPADVMFGIETELAGAAVKQLVARERPRVSAAEIVAYYARHERSYLSAEKRQVEVIHTTSQAAAEEIERASRSGKRLTSIAEPESLIYDKALKGKTVTLLSHTIFKAKLKVVTGPVRVGPNYFVFELTKVIPSFQPPLAGVRAQVEEELEAAAEHRYLASFITAWRAKWRVRTDCSPGFVVQKCRQYPTSRAAAPEAPLSFS